MGSWKSEACRVQRLLAKLYTCATCVTDHVTSTRLSSSKETSGDKQSEINEKSLCPQTFFEGDCHIILLAGARWWLKECAKDGLEEVR